MRRVLLAAVAVFICVGSSSRANLISNGGFESGLDGWSTWAAENMEVLDGWDWTSEGSKMTKMWWDAALWQDFTVTPGIGYNVSANTCHVPWDVLNWGSTGVVGKVVLEWCDAGGGVLSSPWSHQFGSDNQTPGEGLWNRATSGLQVAPQGAANGRVVLAVANDGTGSGCAFFDDVQVGTAVAVPEPSSLALLGLSVFALAATGRKMRR